MIKCGKIGIDCEWCDYKNECLLDIDNNNSLNNLLEQKINDKWAQNNPKDAFIESLKISYKITFNKLVDELYNHIKNYDYSKCEPVPKSLLCGSKHLYEKDLKDKFTYGFFIPYSIHRQPSNFNKLLGYMNYIMEIEELLIKKLGVKDITILESDIKYILDPNIINILIFIRP